MRGERKKGEEEGSVMEKFNERANALASEYWRLKHLTSKEEDEERLEEIERLLEKGIGGKLREKLEREARLLRQAREERSNAMRNLEIVREELLELTAEFAPNLDIAEGSFFPYDSEPLSEDFFRAITDILFGKPEKSIELKEASFSKEGIKVKVDASPLSILDHVITILQETARKKLGLPNKMDESWRKLAQKEYAFVALNVLVNAEQALTFEEVKRISHENDSEFKELVKDAYYDRKLRDALSFLAGDGWEYKLVTSKGGKYEATSFGEWLWKLCNSEMKGTLNKTNGKTNGEERTGILQERMSMQKIIKFFRK